MWLPFLLPKNDYQEGGRFNPMSEDVGVVAPVKRGPGRPRKHPLPEPAPAPENEAPKSDSPSDPSDPRIGQSCDPSWSGIGYDDGSSYRCQDGTIVERIT